MLNKYNKIITMTTPNGLIYIEDFITSDEENTFLQHINNLDWDTTLSRRTQQYGYTYPYKLKNSLVETIPIPEIFSEIKQKIENISEKQFDQLIINEYTPGQGISAHTDHIRLFDDTIAILSLGSDIIMKFTKGDLLYEHFIKRNSLTIMQSDSRYLWKHSIPSRKSDNGVPRNTRISLTFRKKM